MEKLKGVRWNYYGPAIEGKPQHTHVDFKNVDIIRNNDCIICEEDGTRLELAVKAQNGYVVYFKFCQNCGHVVIEEYEHVEDDEGIESVYRGKPLFLVESEIIDAMCHIKDVIEDIQISMKMPGKSREQ